MQERCEWCQQAFRADTVPESGVCKECRRDARAFHWSATGGKSKNQAEDGGD